MKIFEANITHQVSDFLNKNLQKIKFYEEANQRVFDTCGIKYFFDDQVNFEILKEIISENKTLVNEPDRAEYGDFQTNDDLAAKVASLLKHEFPNPKVIIEPTCGKGNFIVASLKTFDTIENVLGVEIYKPYVWETKFNILQFFINNPKAKRPEIIILHYNVFDFDFSQIAQQHLADEILIIGNPPWVTNSKLGILESSNLPAKSNFKKHNGFDAITGKGNFDIAEYITLMMLDAFQYSNGHIAFLVKNSVIKNVVFDQRQRQYKISDLQKHSIDSKKEFNVSVEASLLICKLNTISEYCCKEFDFYNSSSFRNKFGWVNNKFVSDLEHYGHTKDIDGVCPFEWRQGVKHDCAIIMELEKINGHFINGLNEEINLEHGLIYGFLKSSDLKNTVIKSTRKYTIITQKKIGQETSYIQYAYPETYRYLKEHLSLFAARKSSIYKDKPLFSIFGIGDYSFKPFKVAISGLYKSFHFTLVLPQEDRPVMLDDTCYFIGFEKIEFAVYAIILLNSKTTMEFLQSITFSDAKRTFTKEILMRINLFKLASIISKQEIEQQLEYLNDKYSLLLNLDIWDEFIKEMTPDIKRQFVLFE
jgi:hypothetical protein